MIRKSIPNVRQGVGLFLLLTLLFLTVGAFTQKLNIYFGIAATEIFLLVGVSLLVSFWKHHDVQMTYALERPKRGTMLRTAGMFLLAFPLAGVLNGIFLQFLLKFLPPVENISGIPIPSSFFGLLLSLVFFAILPGICEEWVFRGFLFEAFDGFRPIGQIFLTAFLFAIFHYNPYNFIGPFYLGLLLGSIRYRSGSIVPGMVGHALNNSIAIVLGYVAGRADDVADAEMLDATSISSLLTPVTMIFLLLMIVLMAYFLYRLMRGYPNYSAGRTIVFPPGRKERWWIALAVVVSMAIFAGIFMILVQILPNIVSYTG